MVVLLRSLVAATLLAACVPIHPDVPPTPSAAQITSQRVSGAPIYYPDSSGLDRVAPMLLSPPPPGLTPRQQRRYLRTASRAQARVARAQMPATPGKIKVEVDARGANGGVYAPRAKAPVAASGGTATLTKPTTPSWVWWALAACAALLIWHARATR